jgi:hypothetical protein
MNNLGKLCKINYFAIIFAIPLATIFGSRYIDSGKVINLYLRGIMGKHTARARSILDTYIEKFKEINPDGNIGTWTKIGSVGCYFGDPNPNASDYIATIKFADIQFCPNREDTGSWQMEFDDEEPFAIDVESWFSDLACAIHNPDSDVEAKPSDYKIGGARVLTHKNDDRDTALAYQRAKADVLDKLLDRNSISLNK